MFDVDPKWAELVKERGNLPHDLQKRLPGNERGGVNKGKSPGRPSMMPSPTSQQSANSANLVATSMASGLNFPLGNLNNSLLSGLSLGNFDPKNNPLLMPFGGLTNLGALSGLGNLGNLGSMGLTNSLFANLAGLSLPSLAGMEAALNAQVATSSAAAVDAVNNPVVSSASGGKSGGAGSSSGLSNSGGGNSGSSSKSRSKLDQPATSKSSAAAGGPSTLSATSSATSLPTPSPFPFFLSNPSLLYTPLGLGGLNPFSMQPGGVSSAYESLAQCGLLNPPTSSASSVSRKPTSSSSSSRQREAVPESSTSSSSTSSSTAAKRKEAEKKASRYPPVDPTATLQQYTDMAALHGNEDRRGRSVERQQQQQHEKRETTTTEQVDVMAADLSEKKTERKSKEQEMKEALEHLSRTSAELVTRTVDDAPPKHEKLPRNRSNNTDSNNQNSDQQQRSTPSAPSSLEVTLEPVAKKMRTEMDTSSKSSSSNNDLPTIEIEPVTRQTLPTTPTKAVQPPPLQDESNTSSVETNTATKKEVNETATTPTTPTTSTSTSTANTTSPSTTQKSDTANKPAASEAEEDSKGGTKAKKARSGKRLSVEPPPERKNLRSSAGRQARAAAERQARMEGEMQQQQQQQHSEQQQQDSHVAGE